MIPLTSIGLAFLAVAAALMLLLPRRWAAVPLIVNVCYMVLGQGIEIGSFHLFAIRIVVLVGLIRIFVRHERPAGGLNRLDWLMVWWGIWAIAAGGLRDDPNASLVFNLGLAFNALGVYFLLRTFLATRDDVIWFCRIVVILLAPVAIEMLYEQISEHNLFSLLGGVPDSPDIRNGKLRAQGPFAHAILAGTVGAVCLPLAIGLWREYRGTSALGIITCITMVVASASSGPLLSSIAATIALLFWSWRYKMRFLRYAVLGAYLVLDLVMKVPPYYLLARIDLTGGSTGWHRAELIDSGLRHLSEWWLVGTDYTRHWMPTGVSWSPNHTDITNHYLQLGVHGGLPLTMLFVAILTVGFTMVGREVQAQESQNGGRGFFAWALGASLFAHATTAISVSYFDQSFAFIYLTLAAIGTFGGAHQR